MSEQLYDIPLDDTGYSEPYTFSDFVKEMLDCTVGFDNKFEIFWNTLKRESKPQSYMPKDNWGYGICKGDGIYEDGNFTSKTIHD